MSIWLGSTRQLNCLTSELKPEQKAEASIMARASAASEGHNWWLKLFARALILMEVHNWWGKAIPLTGRARPYWHNFYLYEIWRPIVHAAPSTSDCRENTTPIPNKYNIHLCNKYKFTLQQILYHKYKIVQLLKGHGRMRTRFCGHTRGNSCYPPQDGFWNNMKSELNVEDNHEDGIRGLQRLQEVVDCWNTGIITIRLLFM